MLARNASLLVLAAALGSALFVASCAKPASTSCSSNQTECGGSCTSVQTDNLNCGACGKSCGNGQTCNNGSCSCSNGYLSCNGSCVASNADNCGSCGMKCSNGQVCNNGSCSSSCPSGSMMCSDNACSSNSDPAHCGTSCTACGTGASCSNGSCGCSVSGQQLCNGTCIDTTSNSNNCGSCGHACSGGSCSNGVCVSSTGSGGNTGSGGSSSGGNTGNGGSSSGGNTGSGGSSSGGNTGNGGSSSGGNTGSGGTSSGGNTGSGGSSSGGATGSGGSTRPSGCPAVTDVISDFEEGTTGIVTPQQGRQGWWYVFSDATNNGGMSPVANTTGPITSMALQSSDPNYGTCDKWAMEVKTTASHSTWGAGFGTSLNQILPPPASTATTAQTKKAYDVTGYDGISFNIKSATANTTVWFEIPAMNNQPVPDGSIKTSDGTSGGTASAPSSNGTDEYNTRGFFVKNIGTSWTKVYAPFGIMGPRYLPVATASSCSNSAVKCEAPTFVPTGVLGLQFGSYTQFTGEGQFDLTVDDVALYKGTNGLASFTAGTYAVDGSIGSCTKPSGASMKYLTNMYANWKATFVTGSGTSTRVQRPENGNDTVSEGIGYGMLIAVNMNDKALFDALWSYAESSSHSASGMLMTWCIDDGSGGMGSKCSASGGSATDADEDMAFALLVAAKQWGGSPSQGGGTYASQAQTMIGQIWSKDIDANANLPTGGSNFGNVNTRTNPSYFAPAYYQAFSGVDSGHAWKTVAANSLAAINKVANGTTGLVPAWCNGGCAAADTSGMYTDGGIYQYDAHRVPWRVGLDACWNGTTTSSTMLTNNAKFFNNIASPSSGGGIGRIYDIYTLTGAPNSDAALNSMSLIGTAGVGAMAAGNSAFAAKAYQFIIDASYSPASTIPDSNGRVSYSYFNATVGLMSALTMSGNFNKP